MIKLVDLIKENKILIPRRSREERENNFIIATQKRIQQYIKNGGKGDLNLSRTPITTLPDGLNVEGTLDLSYSKITSLPNGLNVGGGINLSYSKITSLPNDLILGDYLYLPNTPLSKKYNKEQIKQMIPRVSRNIYIYI